LKYPVVCQGKEIGMASVQREGMFLHISVQCVFTEPFRGNLLLHAGAQSVDLGPCASGSGSFRWSKRITLRLVGEGPYSFHLEMFAGVFTQIVEQKPFPKLAMLQQGRFQVREGVPGILNL